MLGRHTPEMQTTLPPLTTLPKSFKSKNSIIVYLEKLIYKGERFIKQKFYNYLLIKIQLLITLNGWCQHLFFLWKSIFIVIQCYAITYQILKKYYDSLFFQCLRFNKPGVKNKYFVFGR